MSLKGSYRSFKVGYQKQSYFVLDIHCWSSIQIVDAALAKNKKWSDAMSWTMNLPWAMNHCHEQSLPSWAMIIAMSHEWAMSNVMSHEFLIYVHLGFFSDDVGPTFVGGIENGIWKSWKLFLSWHLTEFANPV
jgi:hypothetical protein